MTLMEDKQLKQLERKIETLSLYIDIFNTQQVHKDSSAYQLALSEVLTQVFLHQSKTQLIFGTSKCKEYFQQCGKVNPQFDIYVQQIKNEKDIPQAVQLLIRILMKKGIIATLLQQTKNLSKQETLKYYYENAFLIVKRQILKDFLAKQEQLTFDITIDQFNQMESQQCLRDIRNMIKKYQNDSQVHTSKAEQAIEMLLDFTNEDTKQEEPNVSEKNATNPLDDIFGFIIPDAGNDHSAQAKNEEKPKADNYDPLLDFTQSKNEETNLQGNCVKEDSQSNLIQSIFDSQVQVLNNNSGQQNVIADKIKQNNQKSHLNIPTLLELLSVYLELKAKNTNTCTFNSTSVFTIGIVKLLTATYGHKSIELGSIKFFQRAAREPSMAYLKNVLSDPQLQKQSPELQLKKLAIQLLSDRTISVLSEVNNLQLFNEYYKENAYLLRSSFLQELNTFLEKTQKHAKFTELYKFDYASKLNQTELFTELHEIEQQQYGKNAQKADESSLAPLQLKERQEVDSVIQNLDVFLSSIKHSLQESIKADEQVENNQLGNQINQESQIANQKQEEHSFEKDGKHNIESQESEQHNSEDDKNEDNQILDKEPHYSEVQEPSQSINQNNQLSAQNITKEKLSDDEQSDKQEFNNSSKDNNESNYDFDQQMHNESGDQKSEIQQQQELHLDFRANDEVYTQQNDDRHSEVLIHEEKQPENENSIQSDQQTSQDIINQNIVLQLSHDFQNKVGGQIIQPNKAVDRSLNGVHKNTTQYVEQFMQQINNAESSSEQELVVSELETANIDITKSQTKKQLQIQKYQGYYVNLVLILQQILQQYEISLDSNQMETLIQLCNAQYSKSKFFSKSQQVLPECNSRNIINKHSSDKHKLELFNRYISQSKVWYETHTYVQYIQPKNDAYFQITEFEQKQLLQNEKIELKKIQYEAIYTHQLDKSALDDKLSNIQFVKEPEIDVIKFNGKLNNIIIKKSQSYISKQFFDPDYVVMHSEDTNCGQCGQAINTEQSEIWPCLYTGQINCINCVPNMSLIPGYLLNGCFQKFMVSENSRIQIEKQLSSPILLTDSLSHHIKSNNRYCQFIRLRRILLHLYVIFLQNNNIVSVNKTFYQDFIEHIVQVIKQFQQKHEFDSILDHVKTNLVAAETRVLDYYPLKLLGKNHEYLGLLQQAILYQYDGKIAIQSTGYIKMIDLVDICINGQLLTKISTAIQQLYQILQLQNDQYVFCSVCKGQISQNDITNIYVCKDCGDAYHQNCSHSCEHETI